MSIIKNSGSVQQTFQCLELITRTEFGQGTITGIHCRFMVSTSVKEVIQGHGVQLRMFGAIDIESFICPKQLDSILKLVTFNSRLSGPQHKIIFKFN